MSDNAVFSYTNEPPSLNHQIAAVEIASKLLGYNENDVARALRAAFTTLCQLEAERDEYRGLGEVIHNLKAENAKLRAKYESAAVVTGNAMVELARLRTALEQYGDSNHWEGYVVYEDGRDVQCWNWTGPEEGPFLAQRALKGE